jgi:peptide-methionine (S)-S-oxide reductase
MGETSHLESITLGAGCFWCLDAVARRTPGIESSVVGYAGGGSSGPPPSYYSLHYARPGNRENREFVESVQLTFDPAVIKLEEVLGLFFQSHDPTTRNQDGANFGPEYHSTIFYHTEEQKLTALNEIRALSDKLGKPVVTSVRPLDKFYEGEPEHQDFYNSNIKHPYCKIVILPKLQKLNKD